jgi:protein-tyrosine phosphatase
MISILAVCTGNVCRSPAAERLLLARLAPYSAQVAVSSAGTQALVGEPVDAQVAELVRRSGGDPADFSARQLSRADVQAADLVLVMTRVHRAAVVAVEPAAVRRTFLLREMAAVGSRVAAAGWPGDVAADPAARLGRLPQLAAAHRVAVARSGDLEVEDPFQRSVDVYERAVATIVAAVDELVTAVT